MLHAGGLQEAWCDYIYVLGVFWQSLIKQCDNHVFGAFSFASAAFLCGIYCGVYKGNFRHCFIDSL